MREPLYGMDAAPHPALDIFLDELQSAPDEDFITREMYEIAVPGISCMHLKNILLIVINYSNILTYRVCRFAALK